MTNTTQIRRRPDGSIDTAFYMAKGREHRSQTAHAMLPASRPAPRRGLPVLGALAAFFLGASAS